MLFFLCTSSFSSLFSFHTNFSVPDLASSVLTLRLVLFVRKPFQNGEPNNLVYLSADPKDSYRRCIGAEKPGYASSCSVCRHVEWSSCHHPNMSRLLIYADIKNCRYVDNRTNGFYKGLLTRPWKCH